MVKKSCCCSNFFSCFPCFSEEKIPSSASCASSDALPSSANPTFSTEAEAGVKHHDSQTSNASNSYYAADSASAEGAPSSSAAPTAASAIPDVVKQDDPRPVESPSTVTSSSTVHPSSANPTFSTEAEAGVKHHDSQTSNASNSYYAADSASAEGASSSSAAPTAASAIPDVVKQDDPRPVESPSTDTSSSAIQTLDIIHKDVIAFQGENLDVDLGRLIDHISHLLEVIKENGKISSKRAYQFWPIKSERVNKVKDFLSEAKDFVKEIIPGDTKSIVRGLLQAMGTAHLATTGLLVVSNVLERFEEISNNQEECLRLLKEMIYLAKIVNQIKERPQLEQGVHDEVKDATEMILEGSIMCCSQMGSSKFKRLFSTTVNKQELVSFTQRLDVIMYKHIPLKMSIVIYDANQCKTGNVSRLYPTNAVGIEEAAGEVIDILEWGSEQNAVAVILHGLGGMGKTTLAQAVFSKLEIKGCKYSKVELSQNINSSPKILKLQEKILKDLMGTEKIPEMSNYVDGQLELERTLEKVPAFIYVDNVLDVDALRNLLPLDMNKAIKVRLLITARDLNVRKACPMKAAPKVYAMRALSSTDAKNLLQKVMFDDPERILDSKQVNHIVEKCGRIPLMLNLVAGALRVAKDKPQEVRGVMEQLENLKGEDFGPDKIEPYFFAYDKLPRDCKDPFLDICSYFHGWDWETVADIVGESELSMLESRALVTKDTNEVVSVHDIILELGRHKSKGVRFRFTHANEAELLFDKKKEDIQAIKGVWLSEIESPLDISALQLDLMYGSLRVLALGNNTTVKGVCTNKFEELVFFKAGITDLPFQVSMSKGLKYLNYKPKGLKLSQMPSSLRHAEFDGRLHAHAFQIYSNDLRQLKELRILKLINFVELTNLPENMDVMSGLRELSLSGCNSIKGLPLSISKCGSLRILRMDGCYSLTELPADFGSLNSLQELHLPWCANLKALPDSLEKLSSLKLLELNQCRGLLNLPSGLGKLTGLVKLDLDYCESLKSIPESIGELKRLQPTFDMSNCFSLKELPNGFCNLSHITHLSLGYADLENLPDGFGTLTSLKVLDLIMNMSLKKLPEGFGQLKYLEELKLESCSGLTELCNDFHCLSSLQNLDLSRCGRLQKLSPDFHCLASLQHLDLLSCETLEGKWMDDVVKLNRLQFVCIKGGEQLVKRWAEIQTEGHQLGSSFVVDAGQDMSMSEDQKENIGKTLLSNFERLLTNGRGESIRLPPNTLFLVICDLNERFWSTFPWPLIEETIDEIEKEAPTIIYIGPHFESLRKKVQERILAWKMTGTGAVQVVTKIFLTLDISTARPSGEGEYYFQMHTKMVGDGKSDKYLPTWKHLTETETEELLLGNCRRYLQLKEVSKTKQESNLELLRELFAHGEEESTSIFQKYYPSQQDGNEDSEPFTCGVDKLGGKNILLEMRPTDSCYDIRLPSLKELYVKEKERLNLEIISIPFVGRVSYTSEASDVYNKFSKEFSREVPWLVLRTPAIARSVKFFLVKECGWVAGDEFEKCYINIICLIESNGRIKTYNPSLFSMLDKWEIFFNHLESVSYQVKWGAKSPLMHENIEELRKEEWKQLKNMSTLEFLCNHLESVFDQVKKTMSPGKMICLFNWNYEMIRCEMMRNAMMEVRDNIQYIYIPSFESENMRTFRITDTIKKEYYYPEPKTGEMEEGISLLNLSGYEAVRFCMRLLHLKKEIKEKDEIDKKFCEIRRLLDSFDQYKRCMIFMYEDGKLAATLRTEILEWLFDYSNYNYPKDRAQSLMQMVIKVFKEEGKQRYHDSSVPDVANNMQTAASVDQETVDVDLNSLSKYTSEVLEYEKLNQFFELNKEGENWSKPNAAGPCAWPTSKGFSMLKNFLCEGVNANWVEDSISRYPKEKKWKIVTKSLLKEIAEEHWAAAGLLVVADVLGKFESVSAYRNECLFLLEQMNSLAIYLKQFNERRGVWTRMKREATGSIVIGSMMCCCQIDPPKFDMFVEKPDDSELISFEEDCREKCEIMASSITNDLGGERRFVLEKMCPCYFVNGDLQFIEDLASESENEDETEGVYDWSIENENEGGPSAENESESGSP